MIIPYNAEYSWIFFLEMRQRGRFAGFSLYVSENGKTEDKYLCYKNEHSPPLNFSKVCEMSGRYIIIFNKRGDILTSFQGYEANNVVMELCEVIVYGNDC